MLSKKSKQKYIPKIVTSEDTILVTLVRGAAITSKDITDMETIFENAAKQNPFFAPKVVSNLLATNNLTLLFAAVSGERMLYLPIIINGKNVQIAGSQGADFLDIIYKTGMATTQLYNCVYKIIEKLNAANYLLTKIASESYAFLLFRKALKKQGYNVNSFNTWVRPTLAFEEEQKDKILKKHYYRGKTKNYINRLNKTEGFVFNIIQEAGDKQAVNNWVNSFCNIHEMRWNNTVTPSTYRYKKNRTQLNTKINQWLQNNNAVLFSLMVNGITLGSAICLKTNTKLIYHNIAINKIHEFRQYPINKLLISFIGEWMIDNNFSVIDFGVGDEKYKYEFSNQEFFVKKITASKVKSSKALFKAKLHRIYQNNNTLQKILNEYLRTKIINKLKVKIPQTKSKLKYYSKNINTSLVKQLLRKRAGKNHSLYYLKKYNQNTATRPLPQEVSFETVAQEQLLNFYKKETLFNDIKRGIYIAFFENKERIPYVLKNKEREILSVAWVSPLSKPETPPNYRPQKQSYVLVDCYTAKNHRGKGYYGMLLNQIIEKYKTDFIIYTDDWNTASQKGILRAGFDYMATLDSSGEKNKWINKEEEKEV